MACFVFDQKVVCCAFCHLISNHCVCRNTTTLQIGNTREHTVRRQICCLSRASGVFVVVSSPPWRQWCSDWCALGCAAIVAFGCVCSSHVSGWLRLDVFGSVLLSVVSCREILCGPLERRGARSLFHTSGRRVMRARLVF